MGSELLLEAVRAFLRRRLRWGENANPVAWLVAAGQGELSMVNVGS